MHAVPRPASRSSAVILAALASLGPWPDAARAQADAPTGVETCTLEPGPTRTVARVLDGETVALDDGSEVRLIGALAPRATDVNAAPDAWPAEQHAMRALANLVLGRSVRLAYGGRRQDRYGRHLAHLFVLGGGTETWVQGSLLVTGAARAYTLPGNAACVDELIAHEGIARRARTGVWAILTYRPKPADRTALLMSRRSQFEIVEGVVVSVSRLKSGVYLNFGADWRSDFTARIGKAALARHPAFSDLLAGIAGKRITVRGWIERRNGPTIDVTDPGQIETRSAQDAAPPLAQNAAPSAAMPARTPLSEAPPDVDAAEAPDAAAPNAHTPGIAAPDTARSPDAQRPDEPLEVRPGAVDL